MHVQVLFDESWKRQDVVVDEDDSLSDGTPNAGIASFREPRVRLPHDGKGRGRALSRALHDRGRFVGRAIVYEHDFVCVLCNGLVETRLEHALEHRGAVIGAELNRGSYHATSVSTAARMRGRSRFATHA